MRKPLNEQQPPGDEQKGDSREPEYADHNGINIVYGKINAGKARKKVDDKENDETADGIHNQFKNQPDGKREQLDKNHCNENTGRADDYIFKQKRHRLYLSISESTIYISMGLLNYVFFHVFS